MLNAVHPVINADPNGSQRTLVRNNNGNEKTHMNIVTNITIATLYIDIYSRII